MKSPEVDWGPKYEDYAVTGAHQLGGVEAMKQRYIDIAKKARADRETAAKLKEVIGTQPSEKRVE